MKFLNQPSAGHLAVLTSPTDAVPVGPGVQVMLVPNPEKQSTWIPMRVVKVTRDRLVFRCACGKPECSRVLDYKLRVGGHHPESK